MVPPDPGIGVEGGSADVAGRQEGGGEIWKVDECLLVLESTQNNGGAPSSCGRFGDFLLFFIAAKS